MRILSCCWGSAGDISPQIYLGGELARRGYDVHVITNPYFEDLVASSNVAFTPVGTRKDHEDLLADSDLFMSRGKTVDQVEEVFSRHYYPFLEPLCVALESLYIPGHTCLLTGELIASISFSEFREVPLISLQISPDIAQRSQFDPRRILPWVGSTMSPNHPVTRLREGMGLSTISAAYNPVKILCLWPEWFAPPQADWPFNTLNTGFVLPSSVSPGDKPRNDGSECEAPEKSIVFTTGSVASGQAEFFITAIEVCQRLGIHGRLVTPNRDQVPERLPSNIEYIPHVPFEVLFSQASLVVHHGGIGTGAIALAAGVPQILCPLAGDQFYNAHRFESLGVGKVIAARDISCEPLIEAVQEMLGCPSVARQCAHWKSRMAEQNGARLAADFFDRDLAALANTVAGAAIDRR